jgi:hypothetical protein
MNPTEMSAHFRAKVSKYTAYQCRYALRDCHNTLTIGQYEYEDPYAKKVWAEIDALRDRLQQVSRKTK